MRRTTVALLAIVILGLSTTAWARGGGKNRQNNPVTPPAPAPVDLKGTLVKAEGNEITVTLKLPVDAVTTSVMIDGIGKTLADLKPGQSVTITLTNGKTTRIDATQPAEAPKEPPKEAAKEAPKEPPKEPAPAK
jgi:hypothetical protein